MAEGAASFIDLPDGAMIPSMVAQAMRKLYRFREVTNPKRPLASPLSNELLREFLRSGDLVATTFYGPVRFNEYGQNVGRDATSLQVRGGVARTVLPAALQASGKHAFDYPAPTSVDCPEHTHERTFLEADCLLCAASTCVRRDRFAGTPVGSVVGCLAGMAVFAVLARHVCRKRLLARQEEKVKQKEDHDNFQRIQSAVNKVANLEFYMCFVGFEDFKAHGKLLSHEVVRAKNQLIVLDTFAEVKTFIDTNQVAFISHQCALALLLTPTLALSLTPSPPIFAPCLWQVASGPKS